MSDEPKEDGIAASQSVYSVGSEKNLVTVKSRETYFKRRKNRTIIALVLASTIATLFVAVVVLAVLYSRIHRTQNICDNENCVKIAASLKESMDTSVDPCDDFYGYVCGRWNEEHHSSDVDDSWFSDRTERVTWRVKELLRQNLTDAEVPWAVMQAKKLYESCRDVEKIDSLGLKPILSTLEKVDLPQVPAALTGKHGDIVKIMAKIRRILGKDVLIGIELGPDPRNSSKTVVLIGTASSHNPLPSYNSEVEKRMKTAKRRPERFDKSSDTDSHNQMTAEKKYMYGVIREVVSNGTAMNCSFKDEATELRDQIIQKLTDSVHDFSEALHDMTESMGNETSIEEEVDDDDYMLVDYLQDVTDKFLMELNSSLVPRKIWRPFMEELFKDVKGLNLSKELVLIGDLDYLKSLAYLIDTTDDNILETAIWFLVVDNLVPHSSRNLRILWEEYMRAVIEYTPEDQSRSLYCADIATWMMGMAVSWLFVDPNFHNEKGTRVVEMLEDIRYAFSSIVLHADWMDRQTKQATLEKAQKMTYVIGHPFWLFEKGMLDDYYKGVDIKEDEFLENMVRIITLITKEELQLDNNYETLHDYYWPADPVDVNAMHSFGINHITIPAAILQFPFYDLGLEALNYGAIGAILGHELTHGFDNSGRLYDTNGRLRQWWTDETIDQYNERTKCFIKHYSDFYIEEVDDYIDGELTLDENIADNGGLREAVLAYKIWNKRHGQEPMLPGFTNFTHEQLLFLSFAHIWCGQSSTESLRWRLEDTHCPGSVRLKGVLQNSPEFSEAWKCPLGSKMNPEKKCKIW